VPGGRPERGRLRGEAPHEQVLVVLPGVPDAAEDLEAGVRELDAALPDERLGRVGQGRAVRRATAQGARRGGHDALGHLEEQARIGQDVLDRLEGPDRASERDARLGVVERQAEVRVHRADRLGRRQHAADLRLAPDQLLGRPPRHADDGLGGQAHPVQLDGAPAPGQVEALEPTHRDAGRPGRHEDLGQAAPPRRGDQQPLAVDRIGHAVRGAVEQEAVPFVAERDVLPRRAGAAAVGDPRRPAAPLDQAGQHVALAGRSRLRQRVHDHAVAGERSRLEPGPPLGGDDRRVEQPVARGAAPALRLVGQHPEPPQPCRRRKVAGVRPPSPVGALTHRLHRELRLDEPHRRVEEHSLLVGERGEQAHGHDLSSLRCRWSGAGAPPAGRRRTAARSRTGSCP
jgi:hypothetical protein